MTDDAMDTDDEAADPTFDLDLSMKSDVDHMIEIFVTQTTRFLSVCSCVSSSQKSWAWKTQSEFHCELNPIEQVWAQAK